MELHGGSRTGHARSLLEGRAARSGRFSERKNSHVRLSADRGRSRDHRTGHESTASDQPALGRDVRRNAAGYCHYSALATVQQGEMIARKIIILLVLSLVSSRLFATDMARKPKGFMGVPWSSS